MNLNEIKFTTGGPVQARGGLYIQRASDKKLYETCLAGEFAYVLACRQIGKTSLMYQTAAMLRENGYHTAVIDLNSIGAPESVKGWYFTLLDELAEKLDLTTDVQTWWDAQPKHNSPNHRFLTFLRGVLLTEIEAKVVVFIDEIDMMRGVEFADDFFAAIRTFYQERAEYLAYHRLTFVLLGVATPDELIDDPVRTPFNIGRRIDLDDFNLTECAPFRDYLVQCYPEYGVTYFEEVYYWTGGHPYLTQKLVWTLIEDTPTEVNERLVQDTVNRLFLSPHISQESNFLFVQKRFRQAPKLNRMLDLYEKLVREDQVVKDNAQSALISRLKLYGLVVAHHETLEVRNNLYKQVFNQTWVKSLKAEVAQAEATRSEAALKEVQVELAETKTQLTDIKTTATDLDMRLTRSTTQLDHLRIQKYVIPVFFALGIVLGNISTYYVGTIPNIDWFRWFSIGGMFLYFIYYLWGFYLYK